MPPPNMKEAWGHLSMFKERETLGTRSISQPLKQTNNLHDKDSALFFTKSICYKSYGTEIPPPQAQRLPRVNSKGERARDANGVEKVAKRTITPPPTNPENTFLHPTNRAEHPRLCDQSNDSPKVKTHPNNNHGAILSYKDPISKHSPHLALGVSTGRGIRSEITKTAKLNESLIGKLPKTSKRPGDRAQKPLETAKSAHEK